MDQDLVNRLQNPPQRPLELDNDPDLLYSLEVFLAVGNASQATYEAVCRAGLRCFSGVKILTYEQVKCRLADITGIHSIKHHICVNHCLTFMGPFKDDETCRRCGEPCYDPKILVANHGKKKVPRQEFYTITIGPQLQALSRSVESATNMRHGYAHLCNIVQEVHAQQQVHEWDNIYHGQLIINAVERGVICENDMMLMLSLDGAQLYRYKTSDCWMYIWIILNLPPHLRYKKKHVLPGGFIPGPKKPKNMDSFMFPGLHSMAILMKHGLCIWDAIKKSVHVSRPFLPLVTADGPGIAQVNGLVGHQGFHGCRLYCSLTGRHKPNAPHYYPALLKPQDYDIPGCNHETIDLHTLNPNPSSEEYKKNLQYVCKSPTDAIYKCRRHETGISKPSLLGALSRTLGMPGCLALDLMHLVLLNLPDLLLGLWHGTIDCDTDDDWSTWDWCVLRGETWKAHGEVVVKTTSYLPGVTVG